MAFCFIASYAIGQNAPQNLKVYSGDYTLNAIGAVGTAKYSYYENDEYQRVYHGDFTLSVEKGNFSGVISGKFKNDLRDGKWTIKGSFGYPQYLDMVMIVNYVEGQPNGAWTATSKKGDQVIDSDKRVLKNGLLIDTWEYSNSEAKSTLIIKMDKEGVIQESDIISGGLTQNIAKCKLGYEILNVSKNVQTGESNVKKVEDPEILDCLYKIEQYTKTYPDSLLDLPYRLERKSMMSELGKFVELPYMLTFTQDIRGAKSYDGRQFYGLYTTELVEQKTREQIRIEEEKRQEEIRIAEEKRLEALRIAEEKRLLEEKKKRIAEEESKINEITDFNPELHQSISDEIKSNCKEFLTNLVNDKYQPSLSFECSAVLTWSPKQLPSFMKESSSEPGWVKAYKANNVVPNLYYQPDYNIEINSVPESFNKVFETDKLANIEKEFEGEKIIMIVSDKLEGLKIDYINSSTNVKLSKEKEITWDELIPEDHKKILEEKIKELEKGKYSLNYRIGILNGEVAAAEIEQTDK